MVKYYLKPEEGGCWSVEKVLANLRRCEEVCYELVCHFYLTTICCLVLRCVVSSWVELSCSSETAIGPEEVTEIMGNIHVPDRVAANVAVQNVESREKSAEVWWARWAIDLLLKFGSWICSVDWDAFGIKFSWNIWLMQTEMVKWFWKKTCWCWMSLARGVRKKPQEAIP